MQFFNNNKANKDSKKDDTLADNVRDFKRNAFNKTKGEQQDFGFIENIDTKAHKTVSGIKQGLSYNVMDLNKNHIEILNKCALENSATELMDILKRSNKSKFKNDILNPLIATGFFEPTIPEKPNSPKQKYRRTGKFVVKIAKN
ncbi:MAG: hypothetical protein FXV79_04035 [Candidatus Thioglobus sp.]|nr:MAG: hypothetical protein FXV80_05100 [Candidatus Thioglobus sp.]KAA0449398.1 MAG: hypothetical protein FXV79_04035 [Candidatus Thioglobus sp.]